MYFGFNVKNLVLRLVLGFRKDAVSSQGQFPNVCTLLNYGQSIKYTKDYISP